VLGSSEIRTEFEDEGSKRRFEETACRGQ